MNAYEIKTIYSNNYVVVADSMGEAERIFEGKYWPTTINTIKLLSKNVQIQKYDEQKKEKNNGL